MEEQTFEVSGGRVVNRDGRDVIPPKRELPPNFKVSRELVTFSGVRPFDEANKEASSATVNTTGDFLYKISNDDNSIVSDGAGNLYVHTLMGNLLTTAAGTKGDWLLRKYGDADHVVYSNEGFPYFRDADGDWYISSLPRRPVITGEQYLLNVQQKVKDEHPELDEEQQKRLVGEIIWKDGYLNLIDRIAHCRTPEEREDLIKANAEPLKKYRESGLPGATDIKAIRDRQGMGSVVLSQAELYEQDILAIKEENPDYNEEQAAAEYARRLQNWLKSFHDMRSYVKNSENLYYLQKKIDDLENNGVLQKYRDSGLDVDGEITKIKAEYVKNQESVFNKVFWGSNNTYSGVSSEYMYPPNDTVFANWFAFPKEYANINEVDKNDKLRKMINGKLQEFNEQFFKAVPVTEADREMGYVSATFDGRTYVRARNVDGFWEIHPDDKELYNETQEAVGREMLIGTVLPGIFKGVGAGVKSLSEFFTKGPSKAVSINPNEIRFSQSSVNGAEEIIQSMKANGWKGDPIDVIKMSDGKLTTIDNTRVVAAREAGIEVKANIHDANELLPKELVERFTTKKGVPTTWGEAIELRIGKQNASFRNDNPLGADTMEKVGK